MSGDFHIREFQRADFLRLWEIDQNCFAPEISYSQLELLAYIRRPKAFTLVAEQSANGQTVVGFIVAEAERRQLGHIITIDILEEARRRGLGSKLLAMAEARLKEAGCRAVILETAVDNVSAVAFYKRHQYFLVKTIPRYYASGVDAFVMKKDLLGEGAGG